MKRLVIIPLFLLCWTTGFTQQILQNNLNMYRSGDEVIKQQVKYKDPGRSGENVLWDFSRLQEENPEYHLKYSLWGRDSLLTGTEHQTMYRYRLSGDSLFCLGYENPTTLMRYASPEVLLHFPFHYKDQIKTHFSGEGIYGERLYLSSMGTNQTIADAYGTLVLPNKDTLWNVLRTRTVKWMAETTLPLSQKKLKKQPFFVRTDSIDMRLAQDSIIYGIETCRWYAKGYRYPVFETVKSVIDRKDSEEVFFHTAFFYPPEKHTYLENDPENQALLEEERAHGSHPTGYDPNNPWYGFTYNLYPNPVIDHLDLEVYLPRPANVKMQLSDRQGRLIKAENWGRLPEGISSRQIDMSLYLRGEYVLNIWLEDSYGVSEVILKR